MAGLVPDWASGCSDSTRVSWISSSKKNLFLGCFPQCLLVNQKSGHVFLLSFVSWSSICSAMLCVCFSSVVCSLPQWFSPPPSSRCWGRSPVLFEITQPQKRGCVCCYFFNSVTKKRNHYQPPSSIPPNCIFFHCRSFKSAL